MQHIVILYMYYCVMNYINICDARVLTAQVTECTPLKLELQDDGLPWRSKEQNFKKISTWCS